MKQKELKLLLTLTLALALLTGCGSTAVSAPAPAAQPTAEATPVPEAPKAEKTMIEEADQVILGSIYTGDEALPAAEAMAVKDGRIIFVGSRTDADGYIGDATEVTEFPEGALITAGLSDGHTHVSQYLVAAFNKLCRIPDGATDEECVEIIRQFAEENPELTFITASGWNNSAFGELGPTANLLDAVSSEKPILALSADGHSYWVNSILLEMAGITAETPDPEGGAIMRYPDGTPSGCTMDTANTLIDKVKPDVDDQVCYDGLWGAENLNIREGYVIRFQAGDNESAKPTKTFIIDHCEDLDQRGELMTYTQGSFVVNNTEDALDLVDLAIECRDRTAGGRYEMTTVKIFMDGIIENQGANLVEEYANNPGYYGTSRWTEEESLVRLGRIIAKANAAGMSVHFHTMGDQAVSDALHAIELAAEEVGVDTVREARNALVHLALVQDTDYERFAKYNVIAVLNPWCFKDPSFFDQQVEYLGEARANEQYPMKSFLDAGVHIAFGTDLGASFTYDSIECFHALTTRTYKNDVPTTVLTASETLSREETLDAMTKGVAYQLKMEDEFGTITVGKQANITVFDQNLLTIADSEIMDTKVIGTMYMGAWLEFVPWQQ